MSLSLLKLLNHLILFIYCICRGFELTWKDLKSVSHSVCPTLCDPMDCSLPGSSAHGISQARILEWVAISYSEFSTYKRPNTIFVLGLSWRLMDPVSLLSMFSAHLYPSTIPISQCTYFFPTVFHTLRVQWRPWLALPSLCAPRQVMSCWCTCGCC